MAEHQIADTDAAMVESVDQHRRGSVNIHAQLERLSIAESVYDMEMSRNDMML